MMIIEMRLAAKDKAFEILDEIKDLGRKKKMAICELEEMLYDCFESSEEDDEDIESEYESGEGEDQDMDFRGRRFYRYGRRYGMRHDDMDDEMSRSYRRGGMRMRMRRRDRMGRFV